MVDFSKKNRPYVVACRELGYYEDHWEEARRFYHAPWLWVWQFVVRGYLAPPPTVWAGE